MRYDVAAASVALFAVVVAPAPTRDTEVITACLSNANGQVRLLGPGQSCTPAERVVTWNAASAGVPYVVDSSRPPKIVGKMIETNMVLLEIDGRAMNVGVTSAGFGHGSGSPPEFWYTTPDCSGTPYLPIYAEQEFYETQLVLGGSVWDQVLYYADPGTAAMVAVGSSQALGGACCTDYHCSGFSRLLGEAQIFDLRSLALVPPLRLMEATFDKVPPGQRK